MRHWGWRVFPRERTAGKEGESICLKGYSVKGWKKTGGGSVPKCSERWHDNQARTASRKVDLHSDGWVGGG